jgi:hypothetical protein
MVAVAAWRRRPFACATAATANLFLPSHAWCAAVRLPMPTICVLPNLRHLAERSAMSSPSPCVGLTIANCTGMATRLRSIKIEPLPVAYRLLQHSRLNAGASVATAQDSRRPQQPMTSLSKPIDETPTEAPALTLRRVNFGAATTLSATGYAPKPSSRSLRISKAAIIADYDARPAVERELALRLAALLWRLRRTTTIETDLLRIQAEILRDRRLGRFVGRV